MTAIADAAEDAAEMTEEMTAENAVVQMTAVGARVQAADAAMNARMIMTADAEQNSAPNLVLSRDLLYSIRTQAADVMNHKIRNY